MGRHLLQLLLGLLLLLGAMLAPRCRSFSISSKRFITRVIGGGQREAAQRRWRFRATQRAVAIIESSFSSCRITCAVVFDPAW